MPSPRFHNFSWNRDSETKVLKSVVRELKSMTEEEFTASLIDAGILTKSGRQLTKPYRELYKEDMAAIEAANARHPAKCECGRPLPQGLPAAPATPRTSTPRRKATASPRGSTVARRKRRP